MEPLPSPQPDEAHPKSEQWTSPEPSRPEERPPPRAAISAAFVSMLCFAAGLSYLAIVKFPAGQSPASSLAGAASVSPLTPALAATPHVELEKDSCYRGDKSLDPAFPEGSYSALPPSWRSAPTMDLFKSKTLAFAERSSPMNTDLPAPKGCRLPSGTR